MRPMAWLSRFFLHPRFISMDSSIDLEAGDSPDLPVSLPQARVLSERRTKWLNLAYRKLSLRPSDGGNRFIVHSLLLPSPAFHSLLIRLFRETYFVINATIDESR